MINQAQCRAQLIMIPAGRLAASVEMFEIARPILRSASYERTRRIARPDLERYNHGMAAWEEFWVPILQQQLAVDPLALSVMCPFAWFITLQFNAAAYVSWKRNRFYVSDSDGGVNAGGDVKPRKMRMEGARGLTQWEYEGLHRCVRAAEGLVFTLSEESRIPGGWRAVQWEEAERSDGYRKLVMDETVVELSKWGMDGEFRICTFRGFRTSAHANVATAITCVAYIFPLVFLCKLVNEASAGLSIDDSAETDASTFVFRACSLPTSHYCTRLSSKSPGPTLRSCRGCSNLARHSKKPSR